MDISDQTPDVPQSLNAPLLAPDQLTQQLLTDHLPNLRLKRLGDDTEAGLLITSLPWPRAAAQPLSLDGRSTYSEALGQWPGEAAGTPRRLLLVADGGNEAPAEISLKPAASAAGGTLPTVEMERFELSPHKEYVWERHLLRIRQGERSIGLAMGLRTAGEVHWWEACRLVVIEETPECLTVEMGGAIPHKIMSLDEMKTYPGLSNPLLHTHNWVNGTIYARIHANGVCEIYAHHINSKFFDDGLDLEDAVPVIGFVSDADTSSLCGTWDGSQESLDLGGVRFDLTEVARFASPEQPGSIEQDGDFLVLQPYQGMELFGGLCPEQLIGDTFIFRAERHIIPRGMARTLRFSLSLSDRSPKVVRYLAPAWWYGICEELLPAPLLPVVNEYEHHLIAARKWIQDSIVQHGFEDGSVPRGTGRNFNEDGIQIRHEPGWEGEIPYAQFLSAWRSGEAADYNAAMRSAYHFTDVIIDHAVKVVRMHGYPPYSFSVPMNRVQGPIAAYLETGDAYLLKAAEAVTANSHYTHMNSWPRLAVGRDACYVRSAVLLYRYFAKDYFRQIAYEGAMTVVQSQRDNGSFGDQGGGTGIHQWGAYITKPWMGLMATNGVLDYLELFPEEEQFAGCIKKFADWLMSERHEVGDPRNEDTENASTVIGWSYQHDFNGTREFYMPMSNTTAFLPGTKQWHMETLGRLLVYSAVRYDNPAYADAWAYAHSGKGEGYGDHGSSAAFHNLPWVQAQLWQAQPSAEGIRIAPLNFGPRTPVEGVILTPEGEVTVQWTGDGAIESPASVVADMSRAFSEELTTV